MNKCTLIASTRFGLEMVVKQELKALEFCDIKASNGKVAFQAALDDIPRANIWLRSAARVFLKMGSFSALTFDDLFEQCKAIAWENVIPGDGVIIVNAKANKSVLKSDRACQSVVKKSIVERLKKHYHVEWLDESGPTFSVQVSIVHDQVLIALDTSGRGLHKRRYREQAGEAPLKETLAAGMVLLSRWHGDELMIDPMCGSGTIPIEAAMIARNIAPGLQRKFAAEAWHIINKSAWDRSRELARSQISTDSDLNIYGYDIDAAAIADSKKNAREAGVLKNITFEQKDISDLWIDQQYGSLITNPPYGRRMAEYKDINQIYLTINRIFRKKKGWSIYVLTADSMFPKYFKRSQPDRVRKLYNGRIRVNYYQYYGETY